LTGNDADLHVGRRLSAGLGLFELTGEDIDMVWVRHLVMQAETGEFVVIGRVVTFHIGTVVHILVLDAVPEVALMLDGESGVVTVMSTAEAQIILDAVTEVTIVGKPRPS